MRHLARFVGFFLFAVAFAVAVVDGARSIADGAWSATSTGAALYWLAPKALVGLQALVTGRLGVWAWERVLAPALFAPACLALAVLALVLFTLSSPPPPQIGRSSRDR